MHVSCPTWRCERFYEIYAFPFKCNSEITFILHNVKNLIQCFRGCAIKLRLLFYPFMDWESYEKAQAGNKLFIFCIY